MKKILILPVLFISLLSFSQIMNDINIVPQPVETKKTEDEFKLDKKTCILSYVDDKAANMLNFYLEKLYGFTLPIKKTVQKDEKYIFFSSIHAESNYPAKDTA